jgi:exonuclease III
MSVKIASLNCNGLRNFDKRFFMFNMFHVMNTDIIFLQETHCDNISLAKKWSKSWSGKCFWSFGTSNSCGVGILVSEKLQNRVHSFNFDAEGRILTVDIDINNVMYHLVNVYMPNNDKERKEFINNLDRHCNKQNVILGGDFNFVENIDLDKSGGNPEYGDIGKSELVSLKQIHRLVDPFRKKFPKEKEYTWQNNNVSCRLDRFYISNHLLNHVEYISHLESIKSDHGIVNLKLSNLYNVSCKGPGYWHCNTKVLDDKYLQQDMATLWETLNRTSSINTEWWENCKLESKRLIVTHSIRLAKEKRLALKDLENQLRKLNKMENCNHGMYSDEILAIKREITLLLDEQFEGSKVRSKAKLLDNQEKPSRYFTKKEKDDANNRFMKTLKTENGEINNLEDIKSEVFDYYSKLYSKEEINPEHAEHFVRDLPQLDQEQSMLCEGLITKEECITAIRKMANDKSPGSDGLPAEFYKQFFCLFAEQFVQFIHYCYKSGELSPSQKHGIITLLCKDPEKTEILGNWRPISLLNVDYKIISKVLATRLSSVLEHVINLDQTCGVPGRTISDNLHLIRNVIDYVNQKDMECILLSLDQTKAFDRVSHEFMFKALKQYKFGPEFIKWIEILYFDTSSQVLVNGFLTDTFKVKRSVRQGCPISPLLYILVIEAFAEKVRNDPDITGIPLPGTNKSVTISQYADDTNLFLRELFSVKKVIKLMDLFGSASGSKLNHDKCWGIWLGAWKNRTDKPLGLNWTNDVHKLCGIKFGNGNILSANWDKLYQKFEKSSNLLLLRSPTFLAKSNLIQCMLGSKLWYVGTVLDIPKHYIKLFQRKMFEVFWGKIPECVNRNTMYGDIGKGGFKIVNVKLKIDALHVKHIIKVLSTEAKWKYFAVYWFGYSLRQFQPDFASNHIPHSATMPVFYSKSIKAFKVLAKGNTNFLNMTTKDIYRYFVSIEAKVPRIVNKFPRINFENVWQNTCNKFIDPVHRDVSWRIVHHVIPVNYYLYEKNIRNYCNCYLCPGVETVIHLFVCCPVVKAFWDYLSYIMNVYLEKSFTYSAKAIIFNSVPACDTQSLHEVSLYVVSLGKYCIWILRNFAKFENKKVTTKSLILMFLCQLKLRIKVDFQRFNLLKFRRVWQNNNSLVQIKNNRSVFVLRPP